MRLHLAPPLRDISLAMLTGIKLAACMHLVSTHVFSVHGTLGPSMMPTLSVRGDSVVVAKRYRRGRGVRVGDVVHIKHPVPEYRGHGAVKRIVGMEGDFVLRGTAPGPARVMEEEERLAGEEEEERRMIQVPEGHCWVVGDNLTESRDSREYGPVPLALIKGKVIAKVLPLKEMKCIKNGIEPV